VISSSIVGPHGHSFGREFSLSDIPLACRNGFLGTKGGPNCLASHGFHQLVIFQPTNRFWPFQGIESAVFVVLAAALLAMVYRTVLRRDA